jgi:hypothetical protein
MPQFKVLCVDGGGIKGLYSAKILSHFEAELRRAHGDSARIVDYADLICGTSTGGLIGLGLALRIPAEQICAFYEEAGPRIFKGSSTWLALVRQTLYGGKNSDAPLREALEQMFQRRTIGESDCLLCIPTYDFTQGTYEVFKFDHPEGRLSRHNALPVVDVALATSAAPTFFPLAQIPGENETQYVDGGVWANNPSLVGLTEAIWHFVGPQKQFDRLSLLSIASLNSSAGKAPLLNRHRSFLRWRQDLFDMGLIAQSEFTHIFLTMLANRQIVPMTYSRIPSAEIARAQSAFITLDGATREAFALMKQYAADMYHAHKNAASVQAFFAEPKTYRTQANRKENLLPEA